MKNKFPVNHIDMRLIVEPDDGNEVLHENTNADSAEKVTFVHDITYLFTLKTVIENR